MFGRIVKISGKEYFVSCCPDTPFSEVLMRAARLAAREEGADYAAGEYRAMVSAATEMEQK